MREFNVKEGIACSENRKATHQYWLLEKLTSFGVCDEKGATHNLKGLELTNNEAMAKLLELCVSLREVHEPKHDPHVTCSGMTITISRDGNHIETDWVEVEWVVNPSIRSIINSVYGIACISADPERRKMFKKIILTRLD